MMILVRAMDASDDMDSVTQLPQKHKGNHSVAT